MSKSSLVKTVAPEKVVDAAAPQHNLSDFKIFIIIATCWLLARLRLCSTVTVSRSARVKTEQKSA